AGTISSPALPLYQPAQPFAATAGHRKTYPKTEPIDKENRP
ncbi:hypothetical protein NEIELOOT_00344, partial [Neisseria elongata subsp. glycolytica ATCC 29315]